MVYRESTGRGIWELFMAGNRQSYSESRSISVHLSPLRYLPSIPSGVRKTKGLDISGVAKAQKKKIHSHIRKEKPLSKQIYSQASFLCQYEATWTNATSLIFWPPERTQASEVSSLILSIQNVHSCWHRKQCEQTTDTARGP